MESIERYTLPSRIIVPTIHPHVVEGPNTPEILKEYESIVKSDYNNNKCLNIFNISNINGMQTLTGSNPFSQPVLRKVVEPSGYKIALPEQVLKSIFKENDVLNILRNNYVDLSMSLDFSKNANALALDLFEQLPQELRDFDRLPALILRYGIKNFDSKYGLGFTFNEDSELRTAKILSQKSSNYSQSNEELFRTGLPSKLGKGNITFYTARQYEPSKENLGVQGFGLGGLGDLNAYWDRLAYSDEDGRVVFVSGEARAQNFSSFLKEHQRSELLSKLKDLREHVKSLESEIADAEQ